MSKSKNKTLDIINNTAKLLVDEESAGKSLHLGGVQEWIIVSPFLADQLKEVEELVVEVEQVDMDCFYWGRMSTKKSIESDDAILEIASLIEG